jgi:RNA polymerase sigma factor (sigma-70 family)
MTAPAVFATGKEPSMKIEYKFAGETVEIEVPDDWGSILIDMDRQEYNNNHKETRRHYHFEACEYEGENFAVEDAALAALFEDENMLLKLPSAIAELIPRQQRLIRQVFFDGKKYTEIAREEGLDPSSVRQATLRAIEKLKKLLQ